MQKFVQSGWAFFLVALVFMIIATMVESPGVYISLGFFWLLLAMVRMARNKQKSSSDQQSNGG